MLYKDGKQFEYTICEYSEKKNTKTVEILIDDMINIVLFKKEFQIWLLIVADFNTHIDISDIVISKQFCETYGIPLNDVSKIIKYVNRVIDKFIKYKMIILL